MFSLQPYKTTARQLAQAVAKGELTAEAASGFFSERVEKFNPRLNAFNFFQKQLIAEDVARCQLQLRDQAPLPLAGVPVALKANIVTAKGETSCSSEILRGFVAGYDATVVKKLKAAGAVISGKTNCDEFAMGSSTENSCFGPTKNPWNLDKVPGGSSGGSAAAVAAALCPLALGSDTGGSIRQPASFCGVVGVKPTYGRVSRYGLVAYGSSLDQIGPFAGDVKDAALLLDVISGHDPLDSTSEKIPATACYAALEKCDPAAKKPLAGKKIGVIAELMQAGVEASVRAAVTDAVAVLRELGATVSDVALPNIKLSIAAYYVIATAEASANLARFDGVRYGYRDQSGGKSLSDLYRHSRSRGFGREVKQRIMLGTFALSSGYYDAYYGKALQVRRALTDDFAKAFANFDLLISPTAPTVAYGLGEKLSDPLAMYLGDICTLAVNLAGLPALSLPCGFDKAGLPIGLQMMAPKLAEEAMFLAALAYENAAGWRGGNAPSL